MSLRRKGRASAFFGLFLVLMTGRAEEPGLAGTLPEDYFPGLRTILDSALRQSHQIVAKQIELEQSKARVLGADALRLPSVGGSLTYASNETAVSSNLDSRSRDSGLFYSLAMNQSLFHWGALKREGDKARLGVLIAQQSHTEAARLLAVTLRRSYLELVVKKSFLRQARYARDLVAAELELAEEKLKSGTLSQGDIAGRKLYLEDVNLKIARDEIEFSGLRRSLARLAGITELPEAEIPAEIPKPSFPAAVSSALLAAMVRDGGRETFQAKVSEMRVREAELNFRIASVRLLPKFNATASLSSENSTYASSNSVTQQGVTRQTIGIGAQWAIFDGFGSRAVKLDALASKRVFELQRQTSADAALDVARGLVQQLELDVRAMAMSEVRLGIAVAQVGKIEQELKLGNVAQTAIDGAKSGLKQNEFNNASARATFLSRWSEFVSLAGADPVLNQIPARHDSTKR